MPKQPFLYLKDYFDYFLKAYPTITAGSRELTNYDDYLNETEFSFSTPLLEFYMFDSFHSRIGIR